MTQNTRPLVSIVIPFYNRKNYVSIMVASVLNQTYHNLELLMIDDGSDDGTDEMINDIRKRDNRVKLLYRKDISDIKGACICRNIGLDNAKGDYIIFFDSDDWITPDCINTRVSFMESRNNLDFAIFPFYKYVDKDSIDGYKISGVEIAEDDYFNLLIRNLPFTVVSNIYKTKSLQEKNILWDENLMSLQDADFNINCLSSGLNYSYATGADIDYFVRMYGNIGSISKSVMSSTHLDSHLYYLNKRRLSLSQRSLKLNYALFLLAESLYMLMQNSSDAINYSYKLINQLKDTRFYYYLSIKNVVCRILTRVSVPLRYIYWLLFPELFIIYKRSCHTREKKGKLLYANSKDLIYKIESIMMC